MFIGVYLFLFLITYIFVLAKGSAGGQRVSPALRRKPWFYYYTSLSIILMLLGLAGYLLLSAWLTILFLGEDSYYNFPQDYIGHGLVGWIAMLVKIAGILSPIFAAFIIKRKFKSVSR